MRPAPISKSLAGSGVVVVRFGDSVADHTDVIVPSKVASQLRISVMPATSPGQPLKPVKVPLTWVLKSALYGVEPLPMVPVYADKSIVNEIVTWVPVESSAKVKGELAGVQELSFASLVQLPTVAPVLTTRLARLKLIVFPASTPAPVTVSNGVSSDAPFRTSAILPNPFWKILDEPVTFIFESVVPQVGPPAKLRHSFGEVVIPIRVPPFEICKMPVSGIMRAVADALAGRKASPTMAAIATMCRRYELR